MADLIGHDLYCPECGTWSGSKTAPPGIRVVVVRAIHGPIPKPAIFDTVSCRGRVCRKWLLIEEVYVGVGNEISKESDYAKEAA